MNPFDLRGPQFLLFYLGLGVVVLAVMILRRRLMEPGGALRERMADPHVIAYLRGGPAEAVAVAVLSLLERKALEADSGYVHAVPGAPGGALLPLDVEILRVCRDPKKVERLGSEPGVREALDAIRRELREKGLLPDVVQKGARWASALTGIGLLAGVAWTKIDIALARGKTNLGFLVILWIVFTIVMLVKASPKRTPRGNRTLKDLEALLAHVRKNPPRAKDEKGLPEPAYATNDLLMLAAVYGMMSLPSPVRQSYENVIPQAALPTHDCSSTSTCGSSSSCGGSSCGGGGGCGGCGGGD